MMSELTVGRRALPPSRLPRNGTVSSAGARVLHTPHPGATGLDSARRFGGAAAALRGGRTDDASHPAAWSGVGSSGARERHGAVARAERCRPDLASASIRREHHGARAGDSHRSSRGHTLPVPLRRQRSASDRPCDHPARSRRGRGDVDERNVGFADDGAGSSTRGAACQPPSRSARLIAPGHPPLRRAGIGYGLTSGRRVSEVDGARFRSLSG